MAKWAARPSTGPPRHDLIGVRSARPYHLIMSCRASLWPRHDLIRVEPCWDGPTACWARCALVPMHLRLTGKKPHVAAPMSPGRYLMTKPYVTIPR